eukprot:scaffold6439_cov167-Amphora_coffeaeformis.AAC.14
MGYCWNECEESGDYVLSPLPFYDILLVVFVCLKMWKAVLCLITRNGAPDTVITVGVIKKFTAAQQTNWSNMKTGQFGEYSRNNGPLCDSFMCFRSILLTSNCDDCDKYNCPSTIFDNNQKSCWKIVPCDKFLSAEKAY